MDSHAAGIETGQSPPCQHAKAQQLSELAEKGMPLPIAAINSTSCEGSACRG